MKFSVVVPFFNEGKHIERCAKSLLSQDFDRKDYEIILIDNGSSDNSCEIVRRYPEIILLHEDKPGPYAARNKGIKVAKGDVIVFTDGDCEVSSDWLTQVNIGMKSTGAPVVLGRRHFAPDISPSLQMAEDYENTKIEYILKTPIQKKYLFGFTNNMAVNAECFKSIGDFREVKRGGDTEFIQRYLSSTDNRGLAFLPEMTICHMEITGIGVWLGKQKIRGKNNRRIGKISGYKKLGTITKLKTFNYCTKKHNLPFVKSIIFFLLLLIGNFYYWLGEMKWSDPDV
jgi:glycosyltransferase involved in cell wall biosynthesis